MKVDARLIAATNRDLRQAVRDGTFREDLYYRLNVFPVAIPPLRERVEDIPLLVWAFLKQFEKTMGRRIERVPVRAMERLKRYPWPGNVRELRNVIERAMITASGPVLHAEPPQSEEGIPTTGLTLEQVERQHILAVLEETGWRVRGAQGAAERLLGLKPTTLESRMQRLGISRRA